MENLSDDELFQAKRMYEVIRVAFHDAKNGIPKDQTTLILKPVRQVYEIAYDFYTNSLTKNK